MQAPGVNTTLAAAPHRSASQLSSHFPFAEICHLDIISTLTLEASFDFGDVAREYWFQWKQTFTFQTQAVVCRCECRYCRCRGGGTCRSGSSVSNLAAAAESLSTVTTLKRPHVLGASFKGPLILHTACVYHTE